jgi:hypothetical protein
MTSHIKRFGDYVIDMDNAPEPPEPQANWHCGIASHKLTGSLNV